MSKLERSSRERRMYRRIRNCVGYLGVILPWIALFSAGICEHPGYDWWWSISATYYQTFAIAGVLVPASIVLLNLFGIAWLVKGETFKFLNDTPEEKEKQQVLSGISSLSLH